VCLGAVRHRAEQPSQIFTFLGLHLHQTCAITDHIGAFAQLTYNNAPFGAQDPADPFTSKLWTWDNTDVRYANTGKIGNMPITYGITANNNPSVQDPWNTTPAWSFPYAVSNVAPTPAAGTLIAGAFAAHVGGVGAYAWINNLVYLELSGYRTINPDTQAKLGADPFRSVTANNGGLWPAPVCPLMTHSGHGHRHWLDALWRTNCQLQVCWIAESSQLPPRARMKVHNSVTSLCSPPSTVRPLARSTMVSLNAKCMATVA
jgi:hypothetical protein